MQKTFRICLSLIAVLIAGGEAFPQRPPMVDLDSIDAATRAMWLIDGSVVDAATGESIPNFTVTPGSLSTDDEGKTTVRWRDNLSRDMADGRFQWPRTSGFSLMRFRVTAEGYRPAITHRIWRGGPHTRIHVRLRLK
jgi:hypothetical protein